MTDLPPAGTYLPDGRMVVGIAHSCPAADGAPRRMVRDVAPVATPATVRCDDCGKSLDMSGVDALRAYVLDHREALR